MPLHLLTRLIFTEIPSMSKLLPWTLIDEQITILDPDYSCVIKGLMTTVKENLLLKRRRQL